MMRKVVALCEKENHGSSGNGVLSLVKPPSRVSPLTPIILYRISSITPTILSTLCLTPIAILVCSEIEESAPENHQMQYPSVLKTKRTKEMSVLAIIPYTKFEQVMFLTY